MAGKSRAEREHELSLAMKAADADLRAKNYRTTVRWTGGVAIAAIVSHALTDFAGKVTIASLGLVLPISVKIGVPLAFTLREGAEGGSSRGHR